MKRRSFLQRTAGLVAGAWLLNLTDSRAAVVKTPGLQLYSLRDDMERDAKATLAAVANMGYREIESYPGSKGFTWGMEPAAFKTYVTGLGLAPVSTHCGMDKEMPALMDKAAAAGFKNVVVSWIGKERRENLDGFRAVADEFNKYGELAKARGMTFGYHNHDYPFIDMNGQTPFNLLVSGTDPKMVTFELDVFWVVEPGKDPVAVFNQFPGRFSMAHLKDRDKANPKNSVVIGQGNLPLTAMMAAGAKAGVTHFFVEVEEYGALTPTESVRQSLAGLKAIRY